MNRLPPFRFTTQDRRDGGQNTILRVGEKRRKLQIYPGCGYRDLVIQLRRLADWVERQIP